MNIKHRQTKLMPNPNNCNIAGPLEILRLFHKYEIVDIVTAENKGDKYFYVTADNMQIEFVVKQKYYGEVFLRHYTRYPLGLELTTCTFEELRQTISVFEHGPYALKLALFVNSVTCHILDIEDAQTKKLTEQYESN